MIRLDRVELLHWDLQPHQVLPLAAGVTLITGENGSGKTSILDAIKVGLGAVRLGGDRSIDSYLLRQAKQVAMIRILADNRPLAGTRRRPFDALGEHREDVVTMAVVMRQEEEATYRREYHLIDGDAVPMSIREGVSDRRSRAPTQRVLTHGDYVERLRKLGIGREYLKLLSLPQGQIASFCHESGPDLFDKLFDVIGGREAFDNWVACLRELNTERREHQHVERELEHRRLELDALGERVRRHHDYRARASTLDHQRAALPHAHIAETRAKVDKLRRDEANARRDLMVSDERLESARQEARAAAQRRVDAEAALAQVRDAVSEAQRAVDPAMTRDAELRARLGELDKIRRAAAGVVARDIVALDHEAETLRVAHAKERAGQDERDGLRAAIDDELARLARGLASFPADVDRFRDALRQGGITHHLLAEVIDVEDDAWAPAIEGYLGRLRFAVLVQDPARWAEAAGLARHHRYAHGVLAPDVRGRSPADDAGLNPIVRVGEARYRSLVARLLRRVAPGEPPDPLEPARHDEQLARDGFHVTRLEARVALEERHYLGRGARERRQAHLVSQRVRLDALERESQRTRDDLQRQLEGLAHERIAQLRRIRWEEARAEHAEIDAAARGATEQLETAKARLAIANAERTRHENGFSEIRAALATADEVASGAESARQSTAARVDKLAQARLGAEGELGALLATPLTPPSDDVQAIVAEGHGLETLRVMVARGERELETYAPEVRDTLLPINHARQIGETEAVEQRLGQLAERQEATRVAAEGAHAQYKEATQRVFAAYFGRLKRDARELDWSVEGRLMPRDDGRFACVVRVAVGDKPPVAHDSEVLSGGQKAALSILMGMTAVSLEADGAAFFVIDEPFSASDVTKMNELGAFLARTGAQYLLSMPTSADLHQCGEWLAAIWICTRGRGGVDVRGQSLLAPPIKVSFAHGARGGPT